MNLLFFIFSYFFYNRFSGVILTEVVMDLADPIKSRNLSFVQPFGINFTSYAGFFNVDEKENAKLFFWFFQFENDTSNTPLIIWLQGQPGLSTLYGLFDEHGPLYMNMATYKVKKRQYSWTNKYHVMYLDPDIDCGFSYSDSNMSTSSLEVIGLRLHYALRQFFVIFPEFKEKDVYLTGELDASRYISMIALLNMEIIDPVNHINIKGMMIGGGFTFDEGIAGYHYILHMLRFISYQEKDELEKYTGIINIYIKAGKLNNALKLIDSTIVKKSKEIGFKTMFDSRYMDQLQYSIAPRLAQKKTFRDKIHVGNKYFKNSIRFFSIHSLRSVMNLLPKILTRYKLLLYEGQFDLMSSHTEIFLTRLKWEGCDVLYYQPRRNWTVTNKFFGWWKGVSNLTYVTVKDAGHMVGITQPKNLYYLLDYFINDKFQ